jgi:PPP family 3-phenylpropionic acid transporter
VEVGRLLKRTGAFFPQDACSWYFFFFYGFWSVPLAYLPLHFRALGIEPDEIAYLSAGAVLGFALGAYAVFLVSPRFFSLSRTLAWSAVLSLLFFLPLLWAETFPALLLLMTTSITLYKAGGVIVDAWAVRTGAEGGVHFEKRRVWGSIGFVFFLFCSGWCIDVFGTGAIVPYGIVLLGFVIFLSIWLASGLEQGSGDLGKPERQGKDLAPAQDQESSSWRFGVFLHLLVVALIWASHGVQSAYLSVYLEALQWPIHEISLAWILAVFGEIVVFIFYPRFQDRVSAVSLLKLSAMFTVLRWVILGQTTEPVLMLFSQSLHAFSFAGVYIASTRIIYRILPNHLRDQGQGWLIVAGTGVGGLCGRVAAGFGARGFESIAEIQILFTFSAWLAAAAFTLSLFLRVPDPEAEPRRHLSA